MITPSSPPLWSPRALWSLGLCLWSAACSAPEIADLPPPEPSGPAAEALPAATPAPPPSAPSAPPPEPSTGGEPIPPGEASGQGPADPSAVGAPPRSSPKVEATPTAELPAPPFTAWTTEVPLTLVGPGGTNLAVLAYEGVRVDVVQVLEARMRVRCAGCTGAAEGAEGWLPLGTVRAAGHPGGSEDPLVAILRFRAGWAGGKNVPEGTNSFALCALVDRGFTWSGDTATWVDGPSRVELRYDGRAWGLAALTPPPTDTVHTCRTEGVGRRPGQPAP